MKHQRLLALLLALTCAVCALAVLFPYRRQLLAPAFAQGKPPAASSTSDTMRPAKAAERQAVAAAITAQLKAFQKGDFQKAAQYQSVNLKRNFPSIAAFRQMMKAGYPEFTNYKSVQFGDARADTSGRHVLMPVTLTGKDGITLHALYVMVKEGKVYRVDGVAGGVRPPSPVAPDAGKDV